LFPPDVVGPALTDDNLWHCHQQQQQQHHCAIECFALQKALILQPYSFSQRHTRAVGKGDASP
jgi:hypothetical protein